jgi:hypothetical protein
VITVPGAQTLSSGTAKAISGVTVAESGKSQTPERFTATLSDTNGKLSVTANGATLTGNGTKSLAISGSLIQVDAALASLTDTDSTSGSDTITVNASDSFGNGATPASIAVTVNAPAVIRAPGVTDAKVAVSHGSTPMLAISGRKVPLARGVSEIKTSAVISEGGDRLVATLQLLNQYAHQFGVSSSDHSLAIDKTLGIVGNDFSFEHAGISELRHSKLA